MTNAVKRFVREAILREKLNKYGALYKLTNGKYYHVITEAYSEKEARKIFMKNLSNAKYLEYDPSEMYKELIKIHKGMYVFEIERA